MAYRPVASLTIYMGFKCDRECSHCYTSSSPSAGEQVVNPVIAESLIKELCAAGLKQVFLDGGEPMLYPEHVDRIAGLCGELGVECTLRTNGHWALAEEKMAIVWRHPKLRIELSVGRWHGNREERERIFAALGLLAKRVLLRWFDSPVEMKDAVEKPPSNLQPVYERICAFGRGRNLALGKNPNELEDLPVCRAVGEHLALLPDHSLWACAGFLVPELWAQGSKDSSHCLGNVRTDPVADCLQKASGSTFLRVLRTAGHYGARKIADELGISAPACTSFMTNCEACRSFVESGTVAALDSARGQKCDEIMERVEQAWTVRQRIHTYP